MATAIQKITLSSARDIPFNKLVLSQSNVRRVKAGVSIEELAESIARRGLIQSLHVRPVLDADGAESGMFEVPAGGRRYRALELLAKQKRLAKTAPVPCVVGDANSDILVDEVSLVENMERAPLHPLDQFRAFQAMRDKGMTEEAIAAAFFVGVNVVKQRLRLASVSQTLLEIYADDGMTLEQLMAFMPECAWLGDAETLTYLHATISTRRHRVRVPETPMYLDALLADQPLTGGLEPRLGETHLRILTIVGFPTATTPGILDELNRLAFPYRWSTRAILLDKTDATKLLTRIRRQWFAKRKSIAAILKEVMTNEASVLVDTDAANKAADADLALQELGADYAGQAYVTATITVWDEDPRVAAEKLRLVEKVIQGRDFTAMPETINAVDAWLGSLPGHAYANVRQPPISTLNLAHMIPLSAVWAGPERDEHFAAPPLLFGKTEGSTPFRLSIHVGDVGHTLIVGPTGAGKSVLLALMALQFRRYQRSQVFAFDFGGSIRAAALAMGGDWHDLGGGLTEGADDSVSLQPLARIEDVAERAWAADWLLAILARESVTIVPEVKEHVWSALTSLASAPIGERTLTGLSVLLQSNDLKQALRPYCVGGPYGRLLDAEVEHLGKATVQAFETEGLIGTGAAAAVLAYLFHRIEDRLDGRPTLIIIDEGWLALDDEGFAGQLREWLKTLRKKNASVIFATQSLSDIDGSAIAPAIIESCQTRILLPNERAIEPQITAIYRRFGLNDRQIEILARAMPKRDYYCQSRRGNRLFELGLSDVALALCAASSKTDQAAIASTVAEHGRDGFLTAWLLRHDLGWAVDLIPNLDNLEKPS